MKIGVFALQGSFLEHITMLKKMQIEAFEVRTAKDANKADAVIIPGGESTTLMKLLTKTGLDKWLKKTKKPIYGTCAGMIVLGKNHLNIVDIETKRNAYGRQQDSFETEIDFMGEKIPAIFIRAPKFARISKDCTVLAKLGSEPVLVQDGNILLGSFHPELTNSTKIHAYFASLTK